MNRGGWLWRDGMEEGARDYAAAVPARCVCIVVQVLMRLLMLRCDDGRG